MTSFPICVVQVFRVERKIIFGVEHDDAESALEEVASGSFDLPDFDDKRWVDTWSLESEEHDAA